MLPNPPLNRSLPVVEREHPNGGVSLDLGLQKATYEALVVVPAAISSGTCIRLSLRIIWEDDQTLF